MNFLFVHQNFPGQYLHIVRSLIADNIARDGTHEIVFMTEPNKNHMNGVRKVTYSRPPSVSTSVHLDAREFEMATRRGQAAYKGAMQIKALGFVPDIIIGHHGWGEMLNLVDAFPGVPILGYFEFYYRIDGTDVNYDPEFVMQQERYSAVRGKNCVNLLALALEQYGQVPTRWQHSTYPEWAQKQIRIIEEGVNLDICKPAPGIAKKTVTVGNLTVTPKQKLVTYVARNLEPYRGFHTLMRALPKILQERPDVIVSVVGGDEISYGAPAPKGTWRETMMQEVGSGIDPKRVHFMGKVSYEDHITLLQRSDAHIYLSYPFVASWSLREALAVGCAIVGGDTETVTEFIKHDENGLVVPTRDHNALADTVLHILKDTKHAARLRAGARAYAEKHLDMADYITRYRANIEDITGKKLIPEVAPVPVKKTAPVKKPAVASKKTVLAAKKPIKRKA
ncbi:MAG TPA: glycosyltransferase [Acidocella sp.]|nr:glycosyltransferase [Acidocella sp.]